VKATSYWKDYWAEKHRIDSPDLQVQVARTRMGEPIDRETWDKTLNYVQNLLEIKSADRILDACGGNGLFASSFRGFCRQVTVVDVSSELLENLRENFPNIITVHSDLIRYLQDSTDEFEKILFYAGVQYFSEFEIFQILQEFKRTLQPGGIIVIGDIPDFNKRDTFLSTDNRFQRCFDNYRDGRETIGTWLTFEWLSEMASYLGFDSCTLKVQPEYQIYSDFRFDVVIRL
jgi:ubiquinone/menaquinone biosynthesis C-methylase UbiE